MSNRYLACSIILLASSCLGSGTAWAQGEPAGAESDKDRIARLEALVSDLSSRLKAQEDKDAAGTRQAVSAPPAAAPSSSPTFGAAPGGGATGGHHVEVYGFAQLDAIQDFKRVNPNWDATLRPSRIPTTKGQFGSNGQTVLSVRQSRLGAKGTGEFAGKPYEAKFEFDLYGTGVDEGQTTIRIRHAYGRWGPVLAGQTNTLFMDADFIPNVIDYFGPPGLIFTRNPQIRVTFLDNDKWMAALALEHPSDDIDAGNIRLISPELASSIRSNEELPDLTAQVQYRGSWGHVTLAGIARKVGYDTIGTPGNKPEGSELGWGINGGLVLKATSQATLRLAAVYGRGIASYINDGGMDLAPRVAVVPAPSQPIFPPSPVVINQLLSAEAVKLLGISSYVDINWSKQFSSALGYSFTRVDNTNFQDPTAFHKGEYASGNLLWTPFSRFMTGVEVLWGKRTDNDGNTGSDVRAQFSFKMSFSTDDIGK